jgi:PAS domain S-box-containing protein
VKEQPRILIVEDQKIVAADLESTLRRLGYSVVGTASSGEEAIRKASELEPSIVLMDIRLRGDMDGIEAARSVRARQDVPIVYLTAYADDETIVRARETAPFGYLVKPFNERELRGAIEVALYKHATERELHARELELAGAEARRQAAEEAERRFRLLIGGIRSSAVFLLDPRGWVATWNEGAERIKGYRAEEIIGEHASIFYTPDDRAEGKPDALMRRARAGEHAEDEGWRVRQDGSRFWAEVVLSAVHDERGDLFGFATVTRDLTERREAETRLQESEARFRLLAENVREVFWISDPDFGHFHYVSSAYEAVWGRPAGELERDPRAFLGSVHEEDTESVLRAMADVVEGVEIGLEYRILRRDGAVRWLRTRGFPVRDGAGRVYRVVGVTEDFTQHRERDENLRFLEEASQLLASSLDHATTLERVANLAVPRIADWCSVDVRDGDRIERLAIAHADPAKLEVVREMGRRYPPEWTATDGSSQVMRTGEPLLVPEITDEMLREAAADEKHLDLLLELGPRSAMIVPMIARGGVLGAITFVAARSGRRYDEDDLSFARELADRAASSIDNARLYEQAVGANRAKSDFLAVMSHELRTPLNAVVGYADLLQLEVPDPLTAIQQEQVGRIKESARHLLYLIEEILTFSQLEAGREEIRLEWTELGEILGEVADMVRPLAEAKGLRFLLRAPPRRLAIETDAHKLRQVLLNLLDNAVKFTDHGEIELMVEPSNEAVALSVRDTGIGILPQHRERMFDAFWQAEQSTTRKVGGAGLGLSVTRHLTQLLGGEISVTSESENGSTFTLRLPIQPSKAIRTV